MIISKSISVSSFFHLLQKKPLPNLLIIKCDNYSVWYEDKLLIISYNKIRKI
ncbi:hypothetical protein HMPREF0083_03437 [Aneurinibacillus aneurinilyticus ATCC 12856]|uniref:Uncharacterized protein n=1 Tax=Aneurinibacillus aneurinilyticus ATCC 12856 TaxID=649747 RepID=U1Y8I7_ANEAE|nr:hypothetical protein HMPREF0083_03437 [Aneurinibacillus aneurinilyticus ATCC 12856]